MKPETFDFLSGGHRENATPVPIPNTEVKSLIGEGTAGFARGRVARCRIIPSLISKEVREFFVFLTGVGPESGISGCEA